MEKYWITERGNTRLVVFALGWAADHRIVSDLIPEGFDALCTCDYRDMQPLCPDDEARMAAYESRYLLAWSFGVWAAEQLFADVGFTRAVALNGTPLPVDDKFGIPPRMIDVTIRGVAKSGTETFNRRAYGSHFDTLRPLLSPRGRDADVDELVRLREQARCNYIPTIVWDEAVVGVNDLIFPPENMRNYWGDRTHLLPLPHYPFGDRELILRYLDL